MGRRNGERSAIACGTVRAVGSSVSGASDATWEGPTWQASNAEGCMAALHAASGHVTRVDIRHVRIDGDDALTWFDVIIGDVPPRPVAN